MTAKTILITGASKGLGAKLAERYAAPGVVLGLCARKKPALADVARLCEAKGATVVTQSLDVTDTKALRHWISKMDQTHPIDLVIANAGIFDGHGPNRKMETGARAADQIATNLDGAINTVNAALPPMRERGRGHIALISSLAALQPLADAPSYSASKAGLMAYGQAMREYLAPENILVSMVYPGHIDTAQNNGYRGRLPLEMPAARAADLIKRGLDRKKTFIAFPKLLLWGIRLNRVLPWQLRAWFNKPLRFEIE